MVNVEEVEFVLLLSQKLITLYPVLKSGNQVAIISPYSQQVKLFQRRFEETFGMSAEKVVDICTVDGCQVNQLNVNHMVQVQVLYCLSIQQILNRANSFCDFI